jgi:hypothetical protein
VDRMGSRIPSDTEYSIPIKSTKFVIRRATVNFWRILRRGMSYVVGISKKAKQQIRQIRIFLNRVFSPTWVQTDRTNFLCAFVLLWNSLTSLPETA